MKRSVVAALLLLLTAGASLTACGGSSNSAGRQASSADTFVRRITTEFARGQSGRLWDELLPADQRVVSRGRFVECLANEGWNLRSIKVLDTYSDPVTVGSRIVAAKAVSVRVTSDEGVTTATMHAVPVNQAWRWILQPSDRHAYVAGTCPRSG